jgi:hypothetical protein
MASVTEATFLNNSNIEEVYEGYLCGVFFLLLRVGSYFVTNDKKIKSLLQVENACLNRT